MLSRKTVEPLTDGDKSADAGFCHCKKPKERRHTLCISSSCGAFAEPKGKSEPKSESGNGDEKKTTQDKRKAVMIEDGDGKRRHVRQDAAKELCQAEGRHRDPQSAEDPEGLL